MRKFYFTFFFIGCALSLNAQFSITGVWVIKYELEQDDETAFEKIPVFGILEFVEDSLKVHSFGYAGEFDSDQEVISMRYTINGNDLLLYDAENEENSVIKILGRGSDTLCLYSPDLFDGLVVLQKLNNNSSPVFNEDSFGQNKSYAVYNHAGVLTDTLSFCFNRIKFSNNGAKKPGGYSIKIIDGHCFLSMMEDERGLLEFVYKQNNELRFMNYFTGNFIVFKLMEEKKSNPIKGKWNSNKSITNPVLLEVGEFSIIVKTNTNSREYNYFITPNQKFIIFVSLSALEKNSVHEFVSLSMLKILNKNQVTFLPISQSADTESGFFQNSITYNKVK